jgi:hypothetical protein
MVFFIVTNPFSSLDEIAIRSILKTPRPMHKKESVAPRSLSASLNRASGRSGMVAATPVSLRAFVGKSKTVNADEIGFARKRLDLCILKEV